MFLVLKSAFLVMRSLVYLPSIIIVVVGLNLANIH
jgi:hypothetical protein